MNWFNWYGLAMLAVIMIPNLVFAAKCKDGFENKWQNRAVETVEQIGRFGCFGCMAVNIPGTWFGFWFDRALTVYLSVNAVLIAAYCLIWAICFRKSTVFRAVALSVLPSAVFLFSGIMLRSVLLTGFAVPFSVCHILLSVKNAMAK